MADVTSGAVNRAASTISRAMGRTASQPNFGVSPASARQTQSFTDAMLKMRARQDSAGGMLAVPGAGQRGGGLLPTYGQGAGRSDDNFLSRIMGRPAAADFRFAQAPGLAMGGRFGPTGYDVRADWRKQQIEAPGATSTPVVVGMEAIEQWNPQIAAASQKLGVPIAVLKSIMAIESGGNPNAYHGDGPGAAVGIMAIVERYHQPEIGLYGDPRDPQSALNIAASILQEGYKKYGSWEDAAAYYFGGDGAFDDDNNYSQNSDIFGTDISTYVGKYKEYYAQFSAGGTPTGAAPAGGVLAAAQTLVGLPYVWGGESRGEGGFDCSGLTFFAYQQQGKTIPRTAAEQHAAAQSVSAKDLQPGDLIFFHGTTGAPGVTHVGIYAGTDAEGNPIMLHAPKEGDVIRYVPINTDFWQSHLTGYGRF